MNATAEKARVIFTAPQITAGFITYEMELLSRYVQPIPLDLSQCTGPFRYTYYGRFLDALRRERAVLCYHFSVMPKYTPLLVTLARLLDCKVIVVPFGIESTYVPDIRYGRDGQSALPAAFCLRDADGGLSAAPSDSARDELLRFGKPRRIRTVYNAVDTETFQPVRRTESDVWSRPATTSRAWNGYGRVSTAWSKRRFFCLTWSSRSLAKSRRSCSSASGASRRRMSYSRAGATAAASARNCTGHRQSTCRLRPGRVSAYRWPKPWPAVVYRSSLTATRCPKWSRIPGTSPRTAMRTRWLRQFAMPWAIPAKVRRRAAGSWSSSPPKCARLPFGKRWSGFWAIHCCTERADADAGCMMCGIAGVFHLDSHPVSLTVLRAMAGILRHRGPDDEGFALFDTSAGTALHLKGPDSPPSVDLLDVREALQRGPYNLGLVERRLAVLDLSAAAHSPMTTADGALTLVFNGEIYNYVELRTELAALGHHFRSTGDTEVLLAAYRQWGPDCVGRFNGMWAFALWDSAQGRLSAPATGSASNHSTTCSSPPSSRSPPSRRPCGRAGW